jgi:hypothetical protein
MLPATRIEDLKKKLTESLKSEHFIIHYGLRNPPEGRGLASDGVRDRVLVLTYLHALESLYNAMTGHPWSRQPPAVDGSDRTHVYVFGDNPLTTFDGVTMLPEIYLPCRSKEPTTQSELLRAAAEAVHEGAHLFNFGKRPYYDSSTEPWVWFDEGIAILMETIVAAGNPDYCRFLVGWIDTPETPLDDEDAKYQAGMFMRYIVKRLGPEIVNRVWNESLPGEGPIDALQRLMPTMKRPETFLSADPAVRDIFASGYCIDPYFIWDHESASLAPDIFFRFGERAVSETFVLTPGKTASAKGDTLDHLACRYYRLYLKGGVGALRVEMMPDGGVASTALKGEVVVVTTERTRLPAVALSQSGPEDDRQGPLSAVLGSLEPNKIDHVVLVVSNCGVKSSEKFFSGHDDNKGYVVNVYAS